MAAAAAEGAVGGQGGGEGTGGAPQITPTGAAGAGTGDAGAGAGGGQGGPGGAGAKTYSYQEDRGNWIPPHRLNEESTKRQTLEQQVAQFKADLEREQKRVRALSGLEPKAEGEVEAEELREAFKRIRPDLAKLDDAKIDRILAAADKLDALEQSDQHRWEMHASSMLESVNEGVQEALGLAKLSERQIDQIANAYTRRAESDKEFLKRHLRGDKTLVEEFVKEFTEDWAGPGRRVATVTAAGQRRPVPSGRGTAPVTRQKPKVDFSNEQAVEDAAVAAFKEHGGSFGS